MGIFKGKNKRKIIVWSTVAILVLATVVGCAVYLGDYYRADDKAINTFLGKDNSYLVQKDGDIVIKAENAKAGFIFYPGGKVEESAYVPLMQELTKHNITCIIVKMPFKLAVLDVNGAEGIMQEFPEIENWYIGGHSLGGSMAGTYLEKNAKDFKGLILLGSYITSDISAKNVDALSIYGSFDLVMNREKYAKYKINLPKDFAEFIIDGGNHAYYGMYGEQDGDGNATIKNEEQIAITAQKIAEFIK